MENASVDGAASFESDAWERFGFPESREEKEEKVTDGQSADAETRPQHVLAQSEHSVGVSSNQPHFFISGLFQC